MQSTEPAGPFARRSGLRIGQQILQQHLHPLRARRSMIRDELSASASSFPRTSSGASGCKSRPCATAPEDRGWRHKRTDSNRHWIGAALRWIRSNSCVRSATRCSSVAFSSRISSSTLFAFRDVPDRGGEQQSFFGLQRAQADFHRKPLAVLASRPQLRCANRSRSAGHPLLTAGEIAWLHPEPAIRMFCPISSSRGNANIDSQPANSPG